MGKRMKRVVSAASSYTKAKIDSTIQTTSSFFGQITTLFSFLSKINQWQLIMNSVVYNLLRDNHDTNRLHG
jgi:hypothetical protein